jgi:hypothetical protein
MSRLKTKRFLTYLIILAVLAWAPVPVGGATVLAQDPPGYVRHVRTLETGDLGVANPAGLAFSPRAGAFYVVASRGPAQPPPVMLELFKVGRFGERDATARIAAAIRDPINMAFDSHANRLLILDPAARKLISVSEKPGGDLDPATVVRYDARSFGLRNPQGMTADPTSGHLYILDATGPRIVHVEPNLGKPGLPAPVAWPWMRSAVTSMS